MMINSELINSVYIRNLELGGDQSVLVRHGGAHKGINPHELNLIKIKNRDLGEECISRALKC